jgi:sugar O-acyltransferase (sialic acid O-acetyltransferase NeuD family)
VVEQQRRIVILGTGGNSVDILDTIHDVTKHSACGYECIGFLDDNELLWGKNIHGLKVLGPLISARDWSDCCFVNGIGTVTNFWRKAAIIAKTGVPHDRFETILHPTASVSKTARLGRGVVVFQNVTITSNVNVGNHVIILPNSVISHDDIIGDYTCIAGGGCISGGVTVGRSCYIGTNSTIINNVEIGDLSLVGMGSVVLRSIPQNSVFAGNPAKFLRPTLQK